MKKHSKKLMGLAVTAMLMASLGMAGCKAKPEETQAVTADTSEAEDMSAKESKEKDPDRLIKIGFVFNEVVSTSAWAQTHELGRLYIEENCDNVETYKVENVPGGADCERVMREFISDGCEIIVGTSFDYLDYMSALAEEFPDLTFINGSGYVYKDNMSTYIAQLEQGRYLSGIVAGSMTKSNKIGYISSLPFPDPIKQVNGFALGVQSVNPDAEVVVLWANSFYDPTTEAICAQTLIDQGCDLIEIDLSSSAVAQLCEEKGIPFIGSSVDMRTFAPTMQLTSCCWTWGPWMAKQVEAVRNGTFQGAWCELTMNDDSMNLAEFNESVPQEVRDLVAAKEKEFRSGTQVFVGPLSDNTGKVRVKEGEVLYGEAANSMQWFLPNVVDNWADKPAN